MSDSNPSTEYDEGKQDRRGGGMVYGLPIFISVLQKCVTSVWYTRKMTDCPQNAWGFLETGATSASQAKPCAERLTTDTRKSVINVAVNID